MPRRICNRSGVRPNKFFASIWINFNLTLQQAGAYSFIYKGLGINLCEWTWRESNPRPKLILNKIVYVVLNTGLLVPHWSFPILNTYHQYLSVFWSCIKQRLQILRLRLYLSSSCNAGCPSNAILLFLTPSKPDQAQNINVALSIF